MILGFKGLTPLSKVTNIDMGVFPFPLSLLLPPPPSSPWGWLCNHRRRKVQNRTVYFLFHTRPHVGCKQNLTARKTAPFFSQMIYVTQTSFNSPNAFIRIFVAINVASKSLPVHPAHYIITTEMKTLINVPKHWKNILYRSQKKLDTTGPPAGTSAQNKLCKVSKSTQFHFPNQKTYLVVSELDHYPTQ